MIGREVLELSRTKDLLLCCQHKEKHKNKLFSKQKQNKKQLDVVCLVVAIVKGIFWKIKKNMIYTETKWCYYNSGSCTVFFRFSRILWTIFEKGTRF